MIEIVRTGSQNCIVDIGRHQFRRYGVPTSGFMDVQSAARANSLVHNKLDAALLELYMPGHQLTFHCKMDISLAGAESEMYLDNNRIYVDQTYQVDKDSRLTIGTMSKGCRIYLAVKGGIQSSLMLGSRSPIKGFFNRTLFKGDRIPIAENINIKSSTSSVSAIQIDSKKDIECFPGPEWHWLKRKHQLSFLSSTYHIGMQSDRMGYRLEGEIINCALEDIYSSAVMPGTIQFLPIGLPLILMRDCQTTGGYPRILQICEEDINQIAQRKPGDEVKFNLSKF